MLAIELLLVKVVLVVVNDVMVVMLIVEMNGPSGYCS